MSSFGITPEPTPETEETVSTPVEETPATESKPKTMLIEVEVDENNGPLRTTDQSDHLYSDEIDERKKADKTGVYYDDLKRMEAEDIRARVEGREPNYETMGGIASTPLLRGTVREEEVAKPESEPEHFSNE